ncbi:alpha/beta fold hydrolase [Arthrobacter sp. B1I2]|uniref:alpha/beta fold hydrolase n=1 Tax=Arthrobacter sp. B1I2 TaxID=3042263 RepID=UPI002789898A|nr:alpha/beta hydrolase [Arthrobacter sp. B1I2]MDQ0731973.1 pimeloyl-ACP methyl ester carboxylesterase [Arthrobacter sp. B1I2]
MKLQAEVVLVHGLWHQPAHFEKLVNALLARRADVRVPLLHRGSLAADTAAVQDAVDACRTQPLVLGHSYGGSVITGLERIRQLVYLAAFVPGAEESAARLGGPGAPINHSMQYNEDGTTSIQPGRARQALYADCTQADSAWATALLVPQQSRTAAAYGCQVHQRY